MTDPIIEPVRLIIPTDAEREIAIDALGYRGRQYGEIPGGFRYHVEDVAQALADQRARYEAVATAQEASSARWVDAVEEADNDTDRGYASGRAHAAEQAALRIREVARG